MWGASKIIRQSSDIQQQYSFIPWIPCGINVGAVLCGICRDPIWLIRTCSRAWWWCQCGAAGRPQSRPPIKIPWCMPPPSFLSFALGWGTCVGKLRKEPHHLECWLCSCCYKSLLWWFLCKHLPFVTRGKKCRVTEIFYPTRFKFAVCKWDCL